MTTFTINDPIFSLIRINPSVDSVALQRFVASINANPYANQEVTSMAFRGNAVFQLVTSDRLTENSGAAAQYDNVRDSSNFVNRGNKFAIQLSEDWFIPKTETINDQTVVTPAAWSQPRFDSTNLATAIHEVNHNASQTFYDEAARLRSTPSYAPELSGASRSAEIARLNLQAEVSGWYADLQTMRSEVAAGRMSATEYNLRVAEGTVASGLISVELDGKVLGFTGSALTSYVYTHAIGVLPPGYYDRAVAEGMLPGVSPNDVKNLLPPALPSTQQILSFDQSYAYDGSLVTVTEFANGRRLTQISGADHAPYSEKTDQRQADGSYLAIKQTLLEVSADLSGAPICSREDYSVSPLGLPSTTSYTFRAGFDSELTSKDVLSLSGNGLSTQITSLFDAQSHITVANSALASTADLLSRTTTAQQANGTWLQDAWHYNAAGTATGHELAHLRANKSMADITAYDTNSAADTSTTFALDGSSVVYDYDQNHTQAWETLVTAYDTQHRVDTVTYYNWNKSINAYDYDNGNTQADWDWFAVTYDSQSRADTVIYHYDATNTQLWIDLDQDQGGAANKDFTSIYTYVDAQVRLDNQTIYLDSGAKRVMDWDQANNQSWDVMNTLYTSAGQADWQRVDWNGGTYFINDWDVANQATWNWSTTTYSAAGLQDIQTTYFDNLTKAVKDWDITAVNANVAGGMGVKFSELTYTASGVLEDYQYTYYNQSRLEVDNDLGNQHAAFNSHTKHYDALGRLDWQSYVYDANSSGVVAKEKITYTDTSGDGLWDVTTKAFDADGNGAADITTSLFTNLNGQTGEKIYNALNQLIEFDYMEAGVHKFGTYGYNAAGALNEYNYWDKDPVTGYNRHQWKDDSGDFGWATYDAAGNRYSCDIHDYGWHTVPGVGGISVLVRTSDSGVGAANVYASHLDPSGNWLFDYVNGVQQGYGGFARVYEGWNTSGRSNNSWMQSEDVPWSVVDAFDSDWSSYETEIYQEDNWELVNNWLPAVSNDVYFTPVYDFEEIWNDQWTYWE